MHQHLIRNVFDQYRQQENRLTHALVQVLARNESLARDFISRFVDGLQLSPKEEFLLSCQRSPGQESEPLAAEKAGEQEAEGRGIPDFWIYRKSDRDERGWAVFCECKVTASLGADQLKNHAKTARGLGFRRLYLLTITPSKAEREMFRFLPPYVQASPAAWSEVYGFFADRRDAESVEDFLDYMHVVEGQMMSSMKEFEPMTRFTGIPFGPQHPYSDREAKATLRALMKELRAQLASRNVLEVDTDIRRKPLVSPWDVIGFKFAQGDPVFTRHPHFTVVIGRDEASIQLTLPHAAEPKYWKRTQTCDEQEITDVVRAVADRLGPLRKPLPRGLCEPKISLYLEQVHFFARRYDTMDGNLQFDVSAFLGDGGESGVKLVPVWLTAFRSILAQTSGANFEAALQVRFPYAEGSACRDAGFVDVLAKSAEALKPFLDLLTG